MPLVPPRWAGGGVTAEAITAPDAASANAATPTVRARLLRVKRAVLIMRFLLHHDVYGGAPTCDESPRCSVRGPCPRSACRAPTDVRPVSARRQWERPVGETLEGPGGGPRGRAGVRLRAAGALVRTGPATQTRWMRESGGYLERPAPSG